jgi:hypothetical protein
MRHGLVRAQRGAGAAMRMQGRPTPATLPRPKITQTPQKSGTVRPSTSASLRRQEAHRDLGRGEA